MTNLSALLLAPLAMVLPAVLPQGQEAGTGMTAETVQGGRMSLPSGPMSLSPRIEPKMPEVQNQVRIEQRVIIRISPRRDSPRSQLSATRPQGPGTRLSERSVGRCVAAESIVGVQPGAGNRLVLFMRDRRVITLALDRTCNARDFYSGAYIERQEDGQLCSGRDVLQSRAGANCEVGALRELVVERD